MHVNYTRKLTCIRPTNSRLIICLTLQEEETLAAYLSELLLGCVGFASVL